MSLLASALANPHNHAAAAASTTSSFLALPISLQNALVSVLIGIATWLITQFLNWLKGKLTKP